MTISESLSGGWSLYYWSFRCWERLLLPTVGPSGHKVRALAKQRHPLLDITVAALRSSKIKRREKRQGGESRTPKGLANLLPFIATNLRLRSQPWAPGLSPRAVVIQQGDTDEGRKGLTVTPPPRLVCPAASPGRSDTDGGTSGRRGITAVLSPQPQRWSVRMLRAREELPAGLQFASPGQNVLQRERGVRGRDCDTREKRDISWISNKMERQGKSGGVCQACKGRSRDIPARHTMKEQKQNSCLDICNRQGFLV
ncbi:uncharacterized protein LOC128822291 [Vidua macroura]|uniref:uncharacterized protein LOC128822291 n=1 Tax=Vidua macroura TaxID=187451 RepID=UPI0023A90F23|nr:uncharacterized protein LOC128822291 [Vidua macroura]